MNRLPPLKALQAFRYAAEAQSFKLAAEQMYVTQAAVSQQIKALEQHLGQKLFRRMVREVELTPEGRQLLPYVSKAFTALEQGVASLGQDPNPNRLTLSVLPSFAGRWLVPRLGAFQQLHPELTIHLSPNLQLASFEDNDLDLAIRFGPGNDPGLSAHLLQKEYLLPVCHPSLIDTEKLIAEQLTQLPLLADDAPDMKKVWPELEQALGIKLEQDATRLYVSDSTMLVEALLSGQGFSMLRFSLAYELLQRGQLICPIPIYLKSVYDYYLVAPESHFKRPKVRQFERWIQQEAETIEQSWQQFSKTQLGEPSSPDKKL